VSLLGFDTSTAATTAAVLRSDGRAFELLPPPARLSGSPGHARELMPAVREVMERAELEASELEAVAVGVGPGGFTGLRIGIATARALASAVGIPVRPVSSLAALAAGIDDPMRLALLDARRDELFAALYGGDELLWPPFAVTPEALVERVRGAGLDPLAAGDGSVRFRAALEAGGIRVAADTEPCHAVSALRVCRLASRVPGTPPEAVLPEYLRAPDARPR